MSNNIKILSIAVIALAIIGAGLFFTKEENPKDEIVPIRILDSPSTVNNWEIIKKLNGRDILEEEGVKLELITSVQSSGGTQSLQALLAKNIDYAGSAWPAWINIIASGGKIKAVVSGQTITKDNPGNGLVVLDNSSIHTSRDLIGKKIAINVLGASADYLIRQYLTQNGLSIEQVQLIVVPNPQIEQVLRSGQVDAGAWHMGSPVEFKIAMDRGGLRELPGSRQIDIAGENTVLGSGFREDFIKEHPETVKRFIIAYEKSRRSVWDEFQKNPERVKKAVAEIYKEKDGNPKLAEYFTSGSTYFSPDYPFTTDRDVQMWIDISISEGKLKPGQIKPSDIYTHEFNPFYKEYLEKKGGK
ncbi:MAG: ABC transporter substrate-binding protein [Candidatus Methanoperedens sp.]